MRILAAVFTCLSLLSATLGLATIINIPDDYPTIQQGIDASFDGDTVLVQPDIYVENINFNGHNVVLASLFLTTGDTTYIASTIIDGDRDGSVITFESGEDSTAQVVGFTIRNGYGQGYYPYFRAGGVTCWDHSAPTIANNIIFDNHVIFAAGGIFCLNSDPLITGNTIRDNDGYEEGGAIYCIQSKPTITGNAIHGNYAYATGGISCHEESCPVISGNTITGNSSYMHGGGIDCSSSSDAVIRGNRLCDNSSVLNGGGISCSRSNPRIERNLISGNAASSGGGIYCWESDPIVVNNTVTANVANGSEPYDGYGGGICSQYGSSPIVINTILWDDTAMVEGNEIYVDSTSSVVVTYCDVKDTLWPGVGNISIDPLFRDPSNGDYHLQSITNPDCGGPGDSPCIDAGDPSIFDGLISCDWGLGEHRSDIGAYGGSAPWAGVHHQDSPIPERFALKQNYPNPFNARTVITYRLPVRSHVRLEIYNLLGQRVTTLVNGREEAGGNMVIWDASGFPSGMYFYRLTTGGFSEARRMVLVK
jgi:hypothetical protein